MMREKLCAGYTDPRLARVYGLAAAGFANVRWMGDYIANSFAEIIALAYRY